MGTTTRITRGMRPMSDQRFIDQLREIKAQKLSPEATFTAQIMAIVENHNRAVEQLSPEKSK
jgi:imidazoleglycerol phosphate synthase glutamine amidotransferase subunit HisH